MLVSMFVVNDHGIVLRFFRASDTHVRLLDLLGDIDFAETYWDQET